MSANISALHAAKTLVALDTINSVTGTQTPTARREELADKARVKYTDRVAIHHAATPIEFAQLAGNREAARRLAAAQLQQIAETYGLGANELIAAVRAHVARCADENPATIKVELSSDMRKQRVITGPLTFDGDGVKALSNINEMVGSWKLKAGVAAWLEGAQYRAMLGQNPRDEAPHIRLEGPPGAGKTYILQQLAPLAFNTRFITCNKVRLIPAAKLLGMNQGQTERFLAEEWEIALDGLLAIDEVAALAKAEKIEALCSSMAANMTRPHYHRTLNAIAGYPNAVQKFVEKEDGFESRFGIRLELTRFTADELTHLFLREANSKGYEIDRATFLEARKYFGRMAVTANTGAARFAKTALDEWSKNVASRCLEDLAAGRITKEDAKIWMPVDIKPVKNAFAPLARFSDAVTVDDVVAELEKDVWGQTHVVRDIADALVTRRRMTARTEQTEKPIGAFLFAGPSSAGKSLLTKAIAKTFMSQQDIADGREPPHKKIDMTTIKSMQTWLGGAQAGYIGFEKECPLVEWMKHNSGGVIEFAEIDKGAEDALDTLMEIFDTGKFVTQAGAELDFSNYVVVGTGNFGNEVGLHKRKKVERKLAEVNKTEPGQVFALGALVTDKGVPVGGGMMTISADFKKGSGRVEIIGNSKKVMDESSRIAYGYVRNNGTRYGIDESALEVLGERDLTIHYEPAAVEKDGPSAGITMATAIVSALRQEIVPPNIAMTGEIGARGKVGPVGGIREKLFAAVQNGCDTFILSEENRKDTLDLPKGMHDRIRLIFVEHFDEVVEAVFNPANAIAVSKDEIPEEVERQVIEARTHSYLERKVRPEHLGRLTGGTAVVFQQHTEERMREIIRKKLHGEARAQLAHIPLELDMDASALDHMMAKWNDDTGPRPIVQALNSRIISPLIYEHSLRPDAFPPESEVLASFVDGQARFAVTRSLIPTTDPAADWVAAALAHPETTFLPAVRPSRLALPTVTMPALKVPALKLPFKRKSKPTQYEH